MVIANYKVFDIIDGELMELPEFNMLKPDLDVFKEYYRLTFKLKNLKVTLMSGDLNNEISMYNTSINAIAELVPNEK